jgi:hypothetical protein
MVSVKTSKFSHLKVPCPRRIIKYQPFSYHFHFHSHRLPAVRRIDELRASLDLYLRLCWIPHHIFHIFLLPCLHKNFTKNRPHKITPLISRYLLRLFPSKKRRVLLTIPTYEWFAFSDSEFFLKSSRPGSS